MSSRIVAEVNQHRDSLTKLISIEESCSNENQERLIDLLNVVMNISMTIEILKESNIGQTLQDIKNKFPTLPVGILAKKVIAKWRKDCKDAEDHVKKISLIEAEGLGLEKKPRPTTQSINISKKMVELPSVERDSDQPLIRAKSFDEDEWNEDHYDRLSEIRRKVMQLFIDAIKPACNESIARFISYNIEDNIHKIHHQERDSKSYTNKAKSLVFNLKNNEQLRIDVAEGIIPVQKFVSLTPAEMAPEELKKNREQLSQTSTKARRSDLYQITAAEIQAAHGIDPNKGEFQCKKCKGKKTSHYSMQTRSSDEPMTVFVCCLTCGNRWRS